MDDPQEALVYSRADFREVNERFVTDLLAAHGAQTPPLLALDLGCGPADIPLRLRVQRPRWRMVAMDAAWAMLKLARDDLRFEDAGGLFLIQGTAQHLPIRSGCIDLIFSNSLLHHLPDPLPFWREIARVAATGASIFVRDLMRPASQDEAKLIVERNAGNEPPLLKEEFYRSLLAAFTAEEVRRQLETAGLGQLRVRPVTDRHMDVDGHL